MGFASVLISPFGGKRRCRLAISGTSLVSRSLPFGHSRGEELLNYMTARSVIRQQEGGPPPGSEIEGALISACAR